MNHENEDDENMEETKQHLGNHASVGEGARALKVRGPRRRGALNFPEEWQGKEGFVVNRKASSTDISKDPPINRIPESKDKYRRKDEAYRSLSFGSAEACA